MMSQELTWFGAVASNSGFTAAGVGGVAAAFAGAADSP
jgi:hypothetical protein